MKDLEREIVEKKALFLEVFERKACNVKEACAAMRLQRSTYYFWRKTDPAFAQAADDVLEGMKDFAESKLFLNIQAGKEASIFFFLKCRAKDRGYVERVDVNHNGVLTLEAVLAESYRIGPGPQDVLAAISPHGESKGDGDGKHEGA